MIKDAGRYDTQFAWMKFQAAYDPEFGQPQPGYKPQGSLWGFVAGETFANANAQGSQSKATLTIRGLPAIVAADQILEVVRGYTWKIAGSRQNVPGNETIYEVFR